MSDQGDAGQWRPATSQSDQYSAPDDTTGPLPVVSSDEDDAPGFPSVSPSSGPSWSGAEDEVSTGGFPAVPEEPPAPKAPAPAPPERSVFDPVERRDAYESPRSPEPEPEDPGPTGTTPRFGTDVAEPSRPAESSFGSFGSESFADKSYEDKPYEPEPFGGRPQEPKAYEDKAAEDQGFLNPPSFETKPFGTYESTPYEEPEGSWGPGTFSSAPENASPAGSFGLPSAQGKGVTAEDQAAENDFFASDDHPPMWDKVVAPAGPPPKPGKPSSGNLRLPEWMRDENGGPAAGAPGGHDGLSEYAEYDDDGKSRRPLYIGLGVLVAGLVAAGSVYALKGNGDNEASNASAPAQSTQTPSAAPTRPAQKQPVRKQLPQFKGVHTKAAGRISDPRSGLSYARLAKPWVVTPKKSPMSEIGFSASQTAVTEKAGTQPKHWARLMSAQLAGAAKSSYAGPGSERAAATELERVYEARMFSFRHKKRVLASQPLTIGGHKGWLVSDFVTYRRKGLKATGDVVAVAVVDTGKEAPGVLFMSVPNTSRKLWPDVNFVVHSLRVS